MNGCNYRELGRYSEVEAEVAMTVAMDLDQAKRIYDQVETLEDIAVSLDEGDDRRERLLSMAVDRLREAGPVRPVVAASLLRLNEKTVRAWKAEGVLLAISDKPRLTLDPDRLHQVLRLVNDLRRAGKTSGLLDEVYRRLNDAQWADNQELLQSLESMHQGAKIRA